MGPWTRYILNCDHIKMLFMSLDAQTLKLCIFSKLKKKCQEMYSDKGGETTDNHRQVCVSCWTKTTTDFPAGLGEIIQALNDTSNQLWEVFRNMPLEQTRTTFQCMPAISRGLEPRKLLHYCYYINSKIKASRQTLPQWKIKPTSAFLWTSTLHGPQVHVREILLLENLSQVCQ